MTTGAFEKIIRYHEQTKHHFHSYARSPGYMDWANQPDPFRSYAGVRACRLPLIKKDPEVRHPDLYKRRHTVPRPFDKESIAGFLELSMGLSAWKGAGQHRWALRMNPSSGNLHPTEAYLIIPALGELAAGVYHYAPLGHALECRTELSDAQWQGLHRHFGMDGFFVALSTIFWRESWKYGERAFRYCNLDAGHALAGLSLSAGLFGWKVTCLDTLSDHRIETILGFDKTAWHPREKEHPEMICFVHPDTQPELPANLPLTAFDNFSDLVYGGMPNELSRERVTWEIIYETEKLTRKPDTTERGFPSGATGFYPETGSKLSAAHIIRSRRSASGYDPQGAMGREPFLAMLDKTLPRREGAPFDGIPAASRVHLLLFVHNVTGMEPGLLFFSRNEADAEEIRRLTRPDFSWEQVTEQLPLFYLRRGDFRLKAIELSCNQEIAGHSAFSLGMIARFRSTIEKEPFRYRHLYRECGMIGQVLYLEAEARGLRGTGIGCFFDDPVHQLMGLSDNRYQSLYHFTVGLPLEDTRLTTHPPYDHLEKSY